MLFVIVNLHGILVEARIRHILNSRHIKTSGHWHALWNWNVVWIGGETEDERDDEGEGRQTSSDSF